MAHLDVHDSGEGTPVVLLHGLTATHRYVVMGSKALERSGHRVIAYDARGHGQSDPAEPYDYPALAADLQRVLDERGIDRAVLAGSSMGAHTLLRFALEQPERALALVVITPAYDPADFPGDLVRLSVGIETVDGRRIEAKVGPARRKRRTADQKRKKSGDGFHRRYRTLSGTGFVLSRRVYHGIRKKKRKYTTVRMRATTVALSAPPRIGQLSGN